MTRTDSSVILAAGEVSRTLRVYPGMSQRIGATWSNNTSAEMKLSVLRLRLAASLLHGPPSGEWDDVNLALPHWIRYHATYEYRAGVRENSCFTCKATFATKDMLIAHFHIPPVSPVGAASLHGKRLLDAGLLWNCERSWIVQKYYPTFPSVHLMMAIYYLALSAQRDHVICVFRQSNHTPVDVFLRKNQDKYIVTARKLVNELRQTGKVNVASLAVIGSQNSKGRFVSSFVASDKLEVQYLTRSFEDEGYGIKYRDNLIKSLRLADLATTNITNQLYYAKLHGLRPLLMVMGQNALYHSCKRFSSYMQSYTPSYSRL